MTPLELLAKFREDVGDDITPYLWSDERVLDYIADAEDMFCRLTDGISDASSAEATLISVEPGTEWYDTHPSVMQIREAYRVDTGAPLTVLNYEDMPMRGMRFDASTGPVRALILGLEEDRMRAWPIPNETVDVRLTVFRRPLVVTGEDDQLVIPARHHEHLLKWVKHLAYLKQDVETFDRSKSSEEGDAFRAYCERVKTEQRRKRHKPRAVAYGGI